MTVLATYATGVGTAVLVALAWVGVQQAWRRTFPERLHDADALAGRMGCLGCVRPEPCAHREQSGACRREEER